MIDARRTRKATDPPRPAHRRPLTAAVVALGVPADAVTVCGVALAAATGVVVAFGMFPAGVALITVGGLMDTLDGHVAERTGTASKRGAFLDSVADRVSDSLIFLGVAAWFARHGDATAALVALGVLAASNVVSYERAKAESLGLDAKGGIMERAERLIFLAVALLVATFVPSVLVFLLAALCALTGATAVGRFGRVWRQASGKAPLLAPRAFSSARRQAWRERRQTERSRRQRRELAPLSTRLRGVFSNGAVREGGRRERARLRRSAHALVHRVDIER